MKRILMMVLIHFCLLGFAQEKFSYEKLLFSSDGLDLVSRELNLMENLNIIVAGIQGFNVVEGYAELGMEVRVSDENDKEMMYNPDMLEGKKLGLDDVVQFNFNITSDFQVGKSYFIKVRMWDKIENREFTKETSIRILPPIQNSHVIVKSKGFEVIANRVYVDQARYYTGNLLHEGEELYVDLFLHSIRPDKKLTIDYEISLYDIENDKSIPVEKDALVLTPENVLSNFNYNIKLEGKQLVPGKKYQFLMKFRSEAIGEMDYQYSFVYLKSDGSSNSEKKEGPNTDFYLNQKEVKNGVIATIGDRIDFQVSNMNLIMDLDNGFGKLGTCMKLYDSKGELVESSDDLFKGYPSVTASTAADVSLNYSVPWSLKENSKYSIEIVVWDKYSKVSYADRLVFKTPKIKEKPYGLNLNKGTAFRYDDKKIKPISTLVYKNGYKSSDVVFKTGDEIIIKTACESLEGINTMGFKSVMELLDENGKVLSEHVERFENFTAGDVFASVTIPNQGVNFGKPLKLVSKLMDINEEVVVLEFTFTVVK